MNRLNQYKLELLTFMGETEEYELLCSQFPQLTEDLRERYSYARDNRSKILGRIKALESLINQQIQCDSINATS